MFRKLSNKTPLFEVSQIILRITYFFVLGFKAKDYYILFIG